MIETDRRRPANATAAVGRAGGRALAAIEQLAGGLGTAVLALGLLVWCAVLALPAAFGLTRPAVGAVRGVRRLADRERARIARWTQDATLDADPPPGRLGDVLADPTVRRELAWLATHGTAGLLLGVLGMTLPVYAVEFLTYPAWWRLLPARDATPTPAFWSVQRWIDAVGIAGLGIGWALLAAAVAPALAGFQLAPGRRLLAPPPGADLRLRVAELTSSRAAALDAHGAELRRIERALHDGAQSRLVAVTMLIGAARRSLARDPAAGEQALERAQHAAEDALADLRAVVRSILPPVLADRGLAGALAGLAADCPVPCRLEVDVPQRCAASTEATAWFVVAEALANVAKHSGAERVRVALRQDGGWLHVRVEDDGRGGATETGGSGLTGIRDRVHAHDGRFTLTSHPGAGTAVEVVLPCGS